MRLHAAIAVLVLACLAATGARAQCAFDQSVPNANEVLTETQPEVTIDFTDEFRLDEVRVVSLDDKAEWPTNWARPAEEVRQTAFRLTKPLPPGKYLVEWNGYLRRHHHADGGSIAFTVAKSGELPPATPAGAEPRAAARRSGSGSPYPMLLGAAGRPRDQ
ncbi:copper resistance protein CopC [Xanthobacter sp.]|uniref:copper resistance CopC family protein n=1 Tax=Xanthobacter sp. TaxID=35809 RepID=UPI0025E026A6|nr:copper resistance protein CopC [Xanthobacter sp.]